MGPCLQSLSRGVPEALEIAGARGAAVAETPLLPPVKKGGSNLGQRHLGNLPLKAKFSER